MNKKINQTKRAMLTSIALAAVALTSPLAQAQTAKVLKLGSILTLTGPSASIGKEGLSVIEYAVKQVNGAGGVRIGADTYALVMWL